jgi:hypothetical protein
MRRNTFEKNFDKRGVGPNIIGYVDAKDSPSETRLICWLRPHHPGFVVMPRFRYLRDPLFLSGCAAYAVNRWLLKPHFHNTFLHNYFNDLFLIPCALPPLLLMQRWLELRSHDGPPTAGEIGFQLLVWSILFEWIGPHIMSHAVGDPWDVVAYAIGGVVAGLWWHWRSRTKQNPIAIAERGVHEF